MIKYNIISYYNIKYIIHIYIYTYTYTHLYLILNVINAYHIPECLPMPTYTFSLN